MQEKMIDMLVCHRCGGNIFCKDRIVVASDGEIKEGVLRCNYCESEFPVNNYIPRFVPSENYTQSFGFQWNKHARTQIDKFCGQHISRDRFYSVTGWPENVKGQKILEAGCGAGRFTQIAIETGAEVFSFDYSNAVDANLENNGLHKNFHLFQADIYNVPLKKRIFDKIFCFGVLQHCPNPKKAFMNLVPYLKSGGEIVIDIYELSLRSFVNPKYWLRPVTKRLSPDKLYEIIKKIVPKIFPVKMWITEKIPYGKYPAFFIPVAYHKGFFPYFDKFSYEQLLEWSVLDTFDKFAPKYDKPQTIYSVKRWFKEAGLKDIKVCFGPNGINGRGIKP